MTISSGSFGVQPARATPGAVSYYTPPETGPLTPHEAPSPHVAANPQSPSSYQDPQGGPYQFDVLDPASPLKILEVADRAEDGDSAGTEQTQGNNKAEQLSLPAKPGEQTAVHDNIASADLQHPWDALKILAQVADRAEDDGSPRSEQTRGNSNQPEQFGPAPWREGLNLSKVDEYIHYKPVQDGVMSPLLVYHLFSSYEKFFHPFFPIIPRENFDHARLPWLSRAEPYLFSAILTVASKDNERVHQICYDHMLQLVSMILVGSDANVEAVEALLILSQWVSHDPQASVGRGAEDKLAWMYIGNALRLGSLLEIDQTSFKNESQEDTVIFNRKRLVWSACYMCDSQVSARLGKGFWARGPGPLSGIKSKDYPTLQPQSPHEDNWALIFQANLELTQIFSNVYDILYSSNGHNWKEMLEGRYEKYLDDFRASTRNWNDDWGALICSTPLKSSLLLTYDYLRLYINSFAYQATISRALTYQRDSQHNPNRPIPLINGSTPDARFIYEALDAAKSLLSTCNNFVDPETLRYMPSSYYLYIIYSAVFLYKAISTTTMTDEERIGTRRMIDKTIILLQKASFSANHMGSRYARLLQLLWRRAPKRSDLRETQHQQSIVSRVSTPQDHSQSGPQSNFDTTNFSGMGDMNNVGFTSSGTFSWLDLGAAWNFATLNNSVSESSAELENDMVDIDMSPFEQSFLVDYSLLDGDNPNLFF
ncbi:hypothetical protein OIDMADRAFT_106749 [Oidiodendron maius Zn]|uniref:Xylanolytic transcriptional activator regulatory domain-containing protein n=1 Tax=Oidiodendron maius (strain Zn) TaxID=913774 RepID=A0A0C3GVH3_OIDMZ|nr:hypothetical protein OIDMADRAFT_106749 [Oidiodendron maius Zn]